MLAHTPLDEVHRELGARMVPFAGFSMPLQYTSILAEHDAVRKSAGLFDLSHMAQFELRGDTVVAWADALTVNRVATMKPWSARYNIVTNEHGGAHDDIIFYRLPDRLLMVANAANADKIARHLDAHNASGTVEITRLHSVRALIAIQGPRALAMLAPHVDIALEDVPYYACRPGAVFSQAALIARTGYTGEDGFELFIDAQAAPAIFRGLLAAGAAAGLVPAGLAARDVLRLEAGMPLYGHELDEELTPYQAGLDWVVKLDKGDFVGRDALLRRKDADRTRIVGLRLEGRVPARQGYAVIGDGAKIGEIRSATFAPAVGGAQIATALIDRSYAEPGKYCEVEIRGVAHAARVVALPFYRRPPTA